MEEMNDKVVNPLRRSKSIVQFDGKDVIKMKSTLREESIEK
jgi:hypothetical protein